MACDWQVVAREVAWEAFRRKLKERIARRLAGRVAAGAALALLDGPFPVGDVIGIITIGWGVLEAVGGIWSAYSAWRFVRRDVLNRTARIIRKLARKYGENFLDNECACEALIDYLRALVRGRRGNGPRFLRLVTSETRVLLRRVKNCMT